MIQSDVFVFLNELRENNNKEWFDANRKRYETIKQNITHVAEILINEIVKFDKSVAGLQAKDCIFRINRDVRFSADKSPYKTNSGVFVCPGGKNSWNAGYYLHIEPCGSFIGGGIYMPGSKVLKVLREEIFHNYNDFLEIVKAKEFTAQFDEFYGEKLKTKPKGFPEDFAGLEYLKLKHLTVVKNLSEQVMTSEKLLDEIQKVFAALYPLNRFINQAIREN
jgi:uncharacterized protein (TIGR02453 family)